MERLQEQQEWHRGRSQERFTVDQSLVGKIIGKQGANIKALREKHDVDVHLSAPSSSGKPTTITVTGASDEIVQKAREQMEYVKMNIPIEASAVGWIIGKGGQNIQDICKKADLHSAHFDDKTSSLELCGLKQQVEDAKMLINVHSEYQSVYQNMDEEQSLIQQSFDELDAAGDRRQKGKGKSGGKGKEKGIGEAKGKGKDGGKGKNGGNKGKRNDEQDEAAADEVNYGGKGEGAGKSRGRGGRGRKGGGK